MTPRPPSPAEPDPLWGRVATALARERGPRAWLRSRPTGLRVVIAVATVLLVGAIVVAVAPRRDLETNHAARAGWAVAGALLLVGVVVAARLLLRPLGERAPSRAGVARFAAFALLLPALLVALLAGGGGGGGNGAGLRPALVCFALGLAFALPVLAVLAVLARRERLPLGQGLLLAAAGGLAGNLGLLLHCPRVEPAHLLLGHATVPLGLLALVGAAAAWRASRQGD